MKMMNDAELENVTGGVELIGAEANVDGTQATLPYCCPKCKTVFNIVAGVNKVKCKNCGHEGVISG